MKLLLVLAAAVPLFGQCSYTVSPTQFSIDPGAVTNQTISVAVASGCPWAATTNTSWLHIDSGQTGTGGGTVTWHADTNTVASARTGTINVAAQEVPVVQAAQVCSYGLNPQTGPDYPATGGSGNFQVQSSCTWTPAPNTGWIQIPAGSGGAVTGNGTVKYTVSGNGCATGRTGSIYVATAPFVLTQDGAASNFSFAPASESFAAAAADDRIAVTTGGGCGWNVYSDVSWLSLTSAATGSGSGSFTIHVLANNSAARSGNLHLNNGATVLLLPVAQAAPLPPPVLLSTIVNAADYAANAVSPGEIVSLFGSNLGPSTPANLQVAANGQSIAKTLGGVQVMFDSVAAAVTYASAGQVNAVVPYELAGNPQTTVQVINGGVASNSMAMPVQPATPAIFTLNALGLGPGAILNQDLTVNGSNNRAARGSVAVIYCTGGGVTNPASVDAAITATPLPYLTLPYAVSIGGQSAVVQYAGGAPGSVAGLVQLNVVVPAAVTPGTAVQVTVTIGGVTSPTGVTLAVQ